MSVKILRYISVYPVILTCSKLELIQYKHFCKLATVGKQLSFEQLLVSVELQLHFRCRLFSV